MTKEKWKPVPKYEDLYMISNKRRVKRLASEVRAFKGCREIPERILDPFEKKKGSGYLYVRLSSNGKSVMKSVDMLYNHVWKGKKTRKIHRFPGITKRNKRWTAYGYDYKKVLWIGSYETELEAVSAKMKFEKEKHERHEHQKNIRKAT